MKLLRKQLLVILATVCMFASSVGPAKGQAPTPFANCRLGVGGAQGDVIGYNMEQLNMGLYLDWRTRSSPPAGLPVAVEYIQTVRVHQDKGANWFGPPRVYASNTYKVSPSLTTIASIASSQPGSLWLIGNEIERVDWWQGDSWSGQDEITPELYAKAFHEIRAVIKAADPTARIAIGGVIQATPLRLEYLDRVWDGYYTEYGYPMGNDIDVWNVHGFILREVRNSWGAEIPAGLNNSAGFLSEYGENYSAILAAHRNIAHFQQFTHALRTWMAAHGERNKPLINTEYGILYKSLGGEQITAPQVSDYLTASLDYLLTTTDENIGYPADGNRLVQGWVWYSLNDTNWNGNLFDPTKALTSVGTTWKNYTSNPAHPLASEPQQNLLVTNLRASPNPAFVSPGGSATVALQADVANSGNTRTTTNNSLEVSFWDGDPGDPGSNQIGSTQILGDLPGCGGFITVEVDWPGRVAGDHVWYVRVEPIANETSVADNTASSVVSVLENLPDADLAMSKTVDNSTPYEGMGSIHYIITVTNNGPDPVTGVVVNDLLPDGVTFESYAATQGIYYTAGPWTVGTLVNGAHAVLTITAKVDNGQAGNPITNSASASADRNDSVPGNDTASVDIVPLASFKTYLPVVLK
jgi:uncharacterized repeat protein (TIGR01451 family)